MIKKKGSSGGANLPTGVLPVTAVEERAIILILIEELNSNMALNLDPCQSFLDRVVSVASLQPTESFLIVGISHEGKTGEALIRAGGKVETHSLQMQ